MTKGFVYFNSVPAGADIYVDNIQVLRPDGKFSKTPEKVELDIGLRTYTLKLEGYDDISETISVTNETLTIHDKFKTYIGKSIPHLLGQSIIQNRKIIELLEIIVKQTKK